jgi:hypothetical protein
MSSKRTGRIPEDESTACGGRMRTGKIVKDLFGLVGAAQCFDGERVNEGR